MKFASLKEWKAYTDEQRNMEARAANLADVAAAERLRRASSLPKPKQGPRVAKTA